MGLAQRAPDSAPQIGLSGVLRVIPTLLATGQADAAEAADDGYVKAELVPEARIIGLEDRGVGAEQLDDQRHRGYPAMPDPPQETRRLLSLLHGGTCHTGTQAKYQD